MLNTIVLNIAYYFKKNVDFNILANSNDVVISATYDLLICEKMSLFKVLGISLRILHD